MIIGISGTMGSGKDTLAKIIESKGFQHFSLADILRSETAKLGRTIDRDSLRKTGNELREKSGPGFLAEKAIKMASTENVVLSSVRTPGEVDLLKQQRDFYLIFVDADIRERYKRVLDRARNLEDKSDFEEFKRKEELELKGDSGSQSISYCKEHADFMIENNGAVEELQEQLDLILTKIGQI